MNQLVALVTVIPEAVWSGILAAAIALAGVLIANRSNTSRLRVQLEHDAAEKQRERASVLRRDVYLRAVEEMAKANNFLGSLPQQDPTKGNLADGLQGFFSTAAKVQLVAEPKTALLVMRLVGQYGELMLRLLAKSQPMHDAKIEINLNDDFYTKAQAEVTRVLGEMRRHRESAKPDEAVLAALDKTLQFQQAQAAAYGEKRAEAWSRFNRGHKDYLRSLLTDLRPLMALQIPVQVAIRRDLGLDADLLALEEEMEVQRLKATEALEKFLHDLGDA